MGAGGASWRFGSSNGGNGCSYTCCCCCGGGGSSTSPTSNWWTRFLNVQGSWHAWVRGRGSRTTERGRNRLGLLITERICWVRERILDLLVRCVGRAL